jgi:dipeptidyl aminopeptidase/acylaminoacyl peptidase
MSRALPVCVLLVGACAPVAPAARSPAAAPPAASAPAAPAADAAPQRAFGLIFDGVPVPKDELVEGVDAFTGPAASVVGTTADSKGLLFRSGTGTSVQLLHLGAPGGEIVPWTNLGDTVKMAWTYAERGDDRILVQVERERGQFGQLGWVERSSGAFTPLSADGAEAVSPASWRADKLAFTSNARNGKDFDVWLAEGDAPPRLALERQGVWTAEGWSDDGRSLFLLTGRSLDDMSLHRWDVVTNQVELVWPGPGEPPAEIKSVRLVDKGRAVLIRSAAGGDQVRLFRLDLARRKRSFILPASPWEVASFRVSPDGKLLAYELNEAGASVVYVGPLARPDKAAKLALPVGVLGTWSFARDGKSLVLAMSTPRSSALLLRVDVASGAATTWLDSGAGDETAGKSASPEAVTIRSFDGLELRAWLYQPWPERRKPAAPVVVLFHHVLGDQARPQHAPEIQLLNAVGFAVLCPDVRGSAGHGQAFARLDDGAKRADAVRDGLAVLEWIASQPGLDARRVVLHGSGYGGFLALALAEAAPARVRGVAVMGAVVDLPMTIEKAAPYARDLVRGIYGDEREPTTRAWMDALSPLGHADRLTVPILMAADAGDERIPAAGAQALVAAVRARGGRAGLILAPAEGSAFAGSQARAAHLTAVAVFSVGVTQ